MCPKLLDHYKVNVRESSPFNEYCGSAEALAAVGLIDLGWLPGLPGNNKTQQRIAFDEHDQPSLLIGKGQRHPRRITILKAGNAYRVLQLASQSEKQRCTDAYNALKHAEAERNRHVTTDLEARAAVMQASHRFKLGEVCRNLNGDLVEIVGEYQLRRVAREDGEFIDRDGSRFSWQYGYLAKELGEDSFFYSAFELRSRDGKPKHLRLIVRDELAWTEQA